MEITKDTPTQEVLDNTNENRNGLMCALAGHVFGIADIRMLKAYTDFGFVKLALVIDAKRKGIFDYGATIREVGERVWDYPNDTDAVLRAIELAVEEKYDEVDFSALKLLDSAGEMLVPMKDVFPAYTNGAGTAPATSSKTSGPDNTAAVEALSKALPDVNGMFDQKQIDKIIKKSLGITRLYASRRVAILEAGAEQGLWLADLENLNIESVEAGPIVQEFRDKQVAKTEEPQPDPEPVQETEEPQPAQSEPQETQASDPPADLSAAALVRIDKLAHDIADAFETLLAEIKKDGDGNRIKLAEDIQSLGEYVSTETERISNNQVHLLLYLQTIDKNMRAILTYFVDPHFDFVDVPDAADFIRYIPDEDDDSDELPPEAGEEPQLQVIEGGDPGVEPVPHTVHDGSLQDCPECYAVRVANAAEDEQQDPEPEPEEEVDPGFREYTDAELDAMDLKELRKEGAKLGIAPARMDRTMRRRIKAKYAELRKAKQAE